MKKVRNLVLLILIPLLLSSCQFYVPIYSGVLPGGMEEGRLKNRAVYLMDYLADGDFEDLANEHLSKSDLLELQEEYEKTLEKMGGHRQCNLVEFGIAQGFSDEDCAFVYFHCNHEYGEIDWILYFDANYTLIQMEMMPDEGSVRDPKLEKF